MFGLMSKKEHYQIVEMLNDEIAKQRRIVQDTEQEAQRKINELQKKLDNVTAECEALSKRIQNVNFQTMEQYKRENDELRIQHEAVIKKADELKEMEKEIQKCISSALHEDGNFKFEGNFAFPGSTSITTDFETDEDGKYAVIRGRTVLDDHTTERVQQAISTRDKFDILLTNLKKYGIYDHIAKELVKFCAVEYTIGYNADCTALELYYTLKTKIPKSPYKVDMS